MINPMVYVCFGICFFMLILYIIAAKITGADGDDDDE